MSRTKLQQYWPFKSISKTPHNFRTLITFTIYVSEDINRKRTCIFRHWPKMTKNYKYFDFWVIFLLNFRDFSCRTHKVCSKGPVIGEDVCEGEGHWEGTEQDVGDGQVRNEDVTGGQHCLTNTNTNTNANTNTNTNTNATEQDVWDGHVCNEDVTGSQHCLT